MEVSIVKYLIYAVLIEVYAVLCCLNRSFVRIQTKHSYQLEQIKLLATVGCCLMRLKNAGKLGSPT